MKGLLVLTFILVAATYCYSQTVENKATSAQQVQTPLPAMGADSASRQEEVVENKPVRIGEAPVPIPNTENKKTKEAKPVQNVPVRKEETIRAILK